MDTDAPQTVYGRLIDILDRRVHGELSVDNVGLMPPEAPLIRLLSAAIRTQTHDVAHIRFTGNTINGELIPDAYIYRLAPLDWPDASAGGPE